MILFVSLVLLFLIIVLFFFSFIIPPFFFPFSSSFIFLPFCYSSFHLFILFDFLSVLALPCSLHLFPFSLFSLLYPQLQFLHWVWRCGGHRQRWIHSLHCSFPSLVFSFLSCTTPPMPSSSLVCLLNQHIFSMITSLLPWSKDIPFGNISSLLPSISPDKELPFCSPLVSKDRQTTQSVPLLEADDTLLSRKRIHHFLKIKQTLTSE